MSEPLLIDREAILEQTLDALSRRLQFGKQQYGEYWKGDFSISSIREELLDALVYLWVLERKLGLDIKSKFKAGDRVEVNGTESGVLIALEKDRDFYLVLTSSGKSLQAKLSELKHLG